MSKVNLREELKKKTIAELSIKETIARQLATSYAGLITNIIHAAFGLFILVSLALNVYLSFRILQVLNGLLQK